jgi:hypothetical protein
VDEIRVYENVQARIPPLFAARPKSCFSFTAAIFVVVVNVMWVALDTSDVQASKTKEHVNPIFLALWQHPDEPE